ncbi:ATP-binding cassette domain-containing protein [Hyphococcus sp.]|uniref:ATP-binding cassette domain-containing protein n=1 Tax=Hyphococcus sp. TaxID=2038636 RepID=UPI002088FEEB|nr:MAG: ABC transporter permease [Marinicaulis sp.]
MIGRPSLGARRDAAFAIGIELANVALGVSAPVLLKLAVDGLTAESAPFGMIVFFVLGFVIAWTATNAMTALKYTFTIRIIDKLARRITVDAARDQLPAIARKREGDSARLQGVLDRLPFSLQIVIDGLLWRAAPLIVQTLISLAIIAALAPPRYVAIMTFVLGAYLVATRHGAARFQETARSAHEAGAAQAQTLGDVLRNARRVVFNGNLSAELDTIGACIAERRRANEAVSRLIAMTATLQSAVLGVGLSVLLILAAADASVGRLTVGDFVLLQAYAFRLALPLGGFGYVLRQAGVAIANLSEALELGGAELAEPQLLLPEPAGLAAIALDGVGFRYGEEWVLRGASALIAPGTFVVLVGSNGSGKSTLAQIIAGLIEPDEGAVLINDQRIRDIDLDERHRLVLYAPQNINLFNRTLRENALYPPTRASEAELSALLADWGFYESGRPIDLDLAVGEQGARLSGGQTQKLELARLAGIQAPAVILDETTSALDLASEERAIQTLRRRFCGRTTLILITHHLALAREADQVLFLRRGCLMTGHHEILLRDFPPYKQFFSEPV